MSRRRSSIKPEVTAVHAIMSSAADASGGDTDISTMLMSCAAAVVKMYGDPRQAGTLPLELTVECQPYKRNPKNRVPVRDVVLCEIDDGARQLLLSHTDCPLATVLRIVELAKALGASVRVTPITCLSASFIHPSWDQK